MTTDARHPTLADALTALTTWEGETPGLWRHALEHGDEPTGETPDELPRVHRFLAGPWRSTALRLAATLAIVAFLGLALRPSLDTRTGLDAGPAAGDAAGDTVLGTPGLGLRGQYTLDADPSRGMSAGEPMARSLDSAQRRLETQSDIEQFMRTFMSERIAADQTAVAVEPASPARHVVRKASIQLRADDVHAAFSLARQLVREARGEYVESAAIRESERGPTAELTLRVEASRLDELLIELRALGEVGEERTDADDVTDRVVDLEARLRNERRVETELLSLLDEREGDELNDILNLRHELGTVREQIERLTAQRDQIGNLVRLATVTVLIRPATAEVATDDPGFWSRVGWRFSRAAVRGVESLFATLATILTVLIGGLPWWILGTAGLVLIWRRWRVRRPRPLPE